MRETICTGVRLPVKGLLGRWTRVSKLNDDYDMRSRSFDSRRPEAMMPDIRSQISIPLPVQSTASLSSVSTIKLLSFSCF